MLVSGSNFFWYQMSAIEGPVLHNPFRSAGSLTRRPYWVLKVENIRYEIYRTFAPHFKVMAKSDPQKTKIFKAYAQNLNLLVSEKYISGLVLDFDETYICPLCCRQFSEADLSTNVENYLTLEDAPPRSLGGSANILTCKECNNVAGHKVDAHLTAGLRAKDVRDFLPGSESKVRFIKDGYTVQGNITVEADGTIKASNSYKNNYALKLNEYIKTISPKDGKNLLSFEFVPGNIDYRRLQIGLLKTAYLVCFGKFGYSFIFNSQCELIRNQIKEPDAEIYPLQFWFIGPFKQEHEGVHIVQNHGLECLMPIFGLTTNIRRVFAAIVPLKDTPILNTVAGFHARLSYNMGHADFARFAHPNGYILDKDVIKELHDFVEKLS